MGAYQGLLSGEFGEPAIDAVPKTIPYGMSESLWSDLTPNGALNRAAHYVLTIVNNHTSTEVTVEEALEIFAVSQPELTEHIGKIGLLVNVPKTLFEDQ